MTDELDMNAAHPFVNFLNQIGLAADNKEIYFVSLLAALSLPDICAALESENGIGVWSEVSVLV